MTTDIIAVNLEEAQACQEILDQLTFYPSDDKVGIIIIAKGDLERLKAFIDKILS